LAFHQGGQKLKSGVMFETPEKKKKKKKSNVGRAIVCLFAGRIEK